MTNPFDPGYFTEEELKDAGFKSLGKNVRIAKTCTIVGLNNIAVGSNVRIDGYCSLIAAGAGYLKLAGFNHVGAYCLLSAGNGVILEEFAGLSQGVRIYSRSDDYTGKYLTGPTVPAKYTGVISGEVLLKRHVIIGSGSVILPGVTIGPGSSVGALSLVTKNLDEWGVYFGCPVKRLKERSKELLRYENQLLSEMAAQGPGLGETPPSA